MALVQLVSSDGKEFAVTEKVASCSVLIKNMLESCSESSDSEEKITLEHVKGGELSLIVEWCEQHQDDGAYDPDEKLVLSDWDEAFFKKLDNDTLFGLVKAANFLDVQVLILQGAEVIGRQLVGKSPMEIRTMFGLDHK